MLPVCRLPPNSRLRATCRASYTAANPRVVFPSRKVFMELLHYAYCELMALVEGHVRSASAVSMTCDAWSNRKRDGFFGITVHWITPSWEVSAAFAICSRTCPQAALGAYVYLFCSVRSHS